MFLLILYLYSKESNKEKNTVYLREVYFPIGCYLYGCLCMYVLFARLFLSFSLPFASGAL